MPNNATPIINSVVEQYEEKCNTILKQMEESLFTFQQQIDQSKLKDLQDSLKKLAKTK